jgi:hypothetical protein
MSNKDRSENFAVMKTMRCAQTRPDFRHPCETDSQTENFPAYVVPRLRGSFLAALRERVRDDTAGLKERRYGNNSWVNGFAIALGLLIGCLAIFGAEIPSRTLNETALIGSSSSAQLHAVRFHDVQAVLGVDAAIRDIAISADGLRAYTIDSNGNLTVYQINVTANEVVPELTRLSTVSLLPGIGDPTSLALPPDGAFAFIAGSNKILAVNLIHLTTVSAVGYELHAPYTWKKEIVSVPLNYTRVAVGPSGKYLYYLADFSSTLAGASVDADTVFGELGAFSCRDFGEFEFAWSRPLVRPKAELSALDRGGNEGFIGPYSLAIAPDEDFAMIAARGVGGIGLFDPALGGMPLRDETVGGLLLLDLQPNTEGNYGDYLSFIPTLVRGEPDFQTRLALAASRTQQHPVVTFWQTGAERSLAGTRTIANAGITIATTGAALQALQWQKGWEAFKDVFANFPLLQAYRRLYEMDMVGATSVALAPRGNLGLLSLAWTNNLGILSLQLSASVVGYGIMDRPLSQIYLRGATAKTVGIGQADLAAEAGAAASEYDELWPEKVSFTANGSYAYVGMRGGILQSGVGQRSGYVDLMELECALMGMGREELAAAALPQELMGLATAGAASRNPRRVATFAGSDTDGDGLSNQVEAYNRFNQAYGDETTMVGHYPETATTVEIANRDAELGVLLPRSGLGYRHRELYAENRANAGLPDAVRAIERAGRIWRARYLGGAAPYADHPQIAVLDMSPPGWGTIAQADGSPAHLGDRFGQVVDIQYPRVGGGEEPVDLVFSNVSDHPFDNSMESAADLDVAALAELVRLLAACPEVAEIPVDPLAAGLLAAVAPLPAKVKAASAMLPADFDGEDNDGNGLVDESGEAGERRYLDSFFQISIQRMEIDLIGASNDEIAPEWEEEIPYGSGLVFVMGNTKLRVSTTLTADSGIDYRLDYNPDEMSVIGVAPGGAVEPFIDYEVESLSILHGHTNVTLRCCRTFSNDRYRLHAAQATEQSATCPQS